MGEPVSVCIKAISNFPGFYGLWFRLSFFATGSWNFYGLNFRSIVYLMDGLFWSFLSEKNRGFLISG